ncbi:hypothetical protein ACSBR2_017520 [Camellia fascicularis]
MQRMLLESNFGASHAKKRVKRIGGDPSSEQLSDYEYEDEVESDNPRKKKGEIEKRIQEMLQEFLQQQQRIKTLWRKSIERHNYERQMFEQEWRQSMEKLERDRLMAE